jgi:Zn-dependent M16 (insulinase) family peptidase
MDMSKELLEDERIRVEAQHSALGENGLKLLAEKLEHATRINESQIPSRIMDGFPIPSVSSISSIDVQTAINPYHKISELPNNTVQSYISNDGHAKDVPYFIQFDRNYRRKMHYF